MFDKKTSAALFVLGLLFSGCGDKPKEEQSHSVEKTIPVKEEVKKTQPEQKPETTVDKAADVVIEQVETAAKKVEEAAKDIQQSAAPVIKDAAQKIKQIQESSEDTIKEVAQKISQATQPAVDTVKNAVATPDGSKLYGKCISCHGATAQNKALGQSQVIKGWSEEKIFNALKGYKDGTYGGMMKGVMKGQVGSLSDKELEALAKHIASF